MKLTLTTSGNTPRATLDGKGEPVKSYNIHLVVMDGEISIGGLGFVTTDAALAGKFEVGSTLELDTDNVKPAPVVEKD